MSISALKSNNMRRNGKTFTTFVTTATSWRALMLVCYVFTILHAAVSMALEATSMEISTDTVTRKDVLRRSIKVGYGGNAIILCKTSRPSNTYFYDEANSRYLEPLSVNHDPLSPYAMLILNGIHQSSTYECWQNETKPILISTTFLSIDASIQTMRIEMGIGDDAALICRHYDKEKIYFQQQPGQNIPPIQIDSSTSILLIKNASAQISTFYCTYLNTNKLIDESVLYVGTPPLPVHNFTCQGQNYNNLTCEFPIPPNNIRPEYNISYLFDYQKEFRRCEFERKHGERAVFVLSTGATTRLCPYNPIANKYEFKLVAKNVLGYSEQKFSVGNHEHVIPPKLDINVANITSNSIHLDWTDSRKVQYKLPLIYHIYIKPHTLEGYYTKSPCNILECNMALTELPYANWNYTLTVKARVNSSIILWNEPRYIHFATKPRIPDRAPKTVVGGFYIHYNSANKEITLYWEELRKYEENGPKFRYYIEELDMNGKVCTFKRTKETAVVFPWSDKQRIYEVRAENAFGKSLAVSRIGAYKPKTAYSPQEIEQLYSNGKYKLLWRHPVDYKQQPPSNYTVFWCQERTVSPKECEGTMHFKVVNSSTTEHSISLENFTFNPITMAVAANYPTWSTGLHWKTCFGALDGQLEKVMPAAEAISSTIIEIKWRLEETCIKVLKGYNITYCGGPTEDQQHCYLETLNNTGAQKYNLTNLKPYSKYNITLVLFSEKRYSPTSDPIFCRTKDAAPEPPTNLSFDKASITSNSLTINWDAPKVTNGKLQLYTIYYKDEIKNYVRTKRIPIKNVTQQGQMRLSDNLDGLSSYTTYEIWVTAWTSKESNKNENEKLRITTLIGRPSTPLNISIIQEDNYYILHWTDPEMLSGRVELYELTFFEGNKTRVTYVQRGSKTTHKCRLKYSGCTDVQQMAVRAVNIVSDQELDEHAFPIKDETVQRRRRYTNPVITTGSVQIQTAISSDKNNYYYLLHQENGKVVRKNIAKDEFCLNQEFTCELLDEDIKTKLTCNPGRKHMLQSSKGFSNSFNCGADTFHWQALVASLLFVGMFLATVVWSYNFIQRQLGVDVKLPDPINDLMNISTKVPDNPTDNKDNDLSDKSKNEAQDEIASSESTTTLNDTSLSSYQHSPLQRKIEPIKTPTLRNDGYLVIDNIFHQKLEKNDASKTPHQTHTYMVLHSNSVQVGSVTAESVISTPTLTQQTIVVASQNNSLSSKNKPAQTKIFTNLALTTGPYVLPDVLPKDCLDKTADFILSGKFHLITYRLNFNTAPGLNFHTPGYKHFRKSSSLIEEYIDS
ncbi:cytokine receptor-like isoform X2 [Eurosta solidaginis]|uniref:cytokine receptor-like isoform X2 n=1 Tax=Eurosta solidaginis TaxID=178769 RepID=UPI0035313875